MVSSTRPDKDTFTNKPGFKLLTTTEVGKLLSLNPSTVRKWCDEDRISYVRGSGGRRWISMSEVERLRQANSYTTVSDAVLRMEAIINERDNELRDLIIEKSGIQYHNFVALDKKILSILKKIEKLEQAAAVKPSINLSEKALRRIVRTALDEAARPAASQVDSRNGEKPAPALDACPGGEFTYSKTVTEAERNRLIGELS